jgi:hypothetical protein
MQISVWLFYVQIVKVLNINFVIIENDFRFKFNYQN